MGSSTGSKGGVPQRPPASQGRVTAGGMVLTIVAMAIALGVTMLLLYGVQYLSIGIYIAPSSSVDLQLALTHAIALPIALHVAARAVSEGPEDAMQATLAALVVELAAVMTFRWWDGAHSLVLPLIVLACLIGPIAARQGARVAAAPYAG